MRSSAKTFSLVVKQAGASIPQLVLRKPPERSSKEKRQRDDRKGFVLHADEKLTAFVELE